MDYFIKVATSAAFTLRNILIFLSGRRTLHNPFKGKDTPWDPYGVAKFDLSELLLGEKILELSASVQSCKSPDVIDGRGRQHSHHAHEKIVGKPGSVDGPGENIRSCPS